MGRIARLAIWLRMSPVDVEAMGPEWIDVMDAVRTRPQKWQQEWMRRR